MVALWAAQTPDTKAVIGGYWARHLHLTVDGSNNISSARIFTGALVFDGAGNYTFSGQQTVGNFQSAFLSGSGTYLMQATGAFSLSNPQQAGTTMNGRLGTGAFLASTTESGAGIHDVMIALPASTTTPALSGTYLVSSLDFPGGAGNQVRNSFFRMSVSGLGSFGSVSLTGQAANLGGQTLTQTVNGITYSVTADGRGTLNFPLGPGQNSTQQVVSGAKTRYVSPDGNFFLAGSNSVGAAGL